MEDDMNKKDEELVGLVNELIEPLTPEVHKNYLINVLTYSKYKNKTVAEVLREELRAMKAMDKPEPAVHPWDDNTIQFPRLIAEICANVEFKPEHWLDLQNSMCLSQDELNELFDRANAEWEAKKAKHCRG